jgi:hypothetical protein
VMPGLLVQTRGFLAAANEEPGEVMLLPLPWMLVFLLVNACVGVVSHVMQWQLE